MVFFYHSLLFGVSLGVMETIVRNRCLIVVNQECFEMGISNLE